MSEESGSRKSICDIRFSSIRRDASGKVYNKFHKNVKSRRRCTKTKLRFVERSKYEKHAMSHKERRSCANFLRNLSIRLRLWFGNVNLLPKISGDESHEKADNDDDDDPVQFKVHKIVSLRSYASDLCTSDYHSENYVIVLHKMRYVQFVCYIIYSTLYILVHG